MDPKEIAKHITEDPDVFTESGEPDTIEFPGNDKKKNSKKRKRRIKKIKRRNKQRRQFKKDQSEYEVNKVTGQPNKGKILYSDVPTDNPQEITEAQREAPLNRGELAYLFIKLGKQMDNSWTSGKDQGMEAWKLNNSLMRGVRGHIIKIKLALKSFTSHENCQFLKDFDLFEAIINEAILAANGKEEISYIDFPPPNWWGKKSWASRIEKVGYIEIFMGEVLTRYFGMIEVRREDHARECDNRECIRESHAAYVLSEVCEGTKIRLTEVFDDFKNRRRQAFKTINKSVKQERPKKYAPSDPYLVKLLTLEKYLRGTLGKTFAKTPLSRMLSYQPEDMEEHTKQYIAAAKSYFGEELVDRLWQKVSK